jgi:hypothetical protein
MPALCEPCPDPEPTGESLSVDTNIWCPPLGTARIAFSIIWLIQGQERKQQPLSPHGATQFPDDPTTAVVDQGGLL